MDRDNLEIRPLQNEALLDGVPLSLRAAEFRLLALLASDPDRAFSRTEIIETLHGTRFASTAKAVDVLICTLRKKLGNAADRIEAVRGVGYRFRSAIQ